MKLCYWDLRGLGEVCRYLLRFSETKWEDDRMEISAENGQKWHSEKSSMDMDLPNLPYLIDGDIKVTQSVAIVRYLARKFGLVPGKLERDIVRCEMAEQEIMDFHKAFATLCYRPQEDFEKNKPSYHATLDLKLAAFDKFVGEGPFIMGDKLTYVDFMVYEYMSQVRKLSPDNVAKAGNVVRLMENFEKLPTLNKFFDSGEHQKEQFINAPYATFNGKN